MCKEGIRIGRHSVVNRTVIQNTSAGNVYNILPANPNRVALIWDCRFSGDPTLIWSFTLAIGSSPTDYHVISGVNQFQQTGIARIETHGQVMLGPVSVIQQAPQDSILTLTEISLIEPLEQV